MNFKSTSTLSHYLLASLLFFLFLAPAITFGQDQQAAVDKIFAWASQSTPGCACVVSKNGKVVLSRTYGMADLGKAAPITTQTTFDIGSTRKQFIAAVILSLVEDKKLALGDDIRKYLPELPNYGTKITINHLLTHTSGIRDWTGLLPMAAGDPTALELIMRQKQLNFVPGEQWSYSNSGYVLLTEIAAKAAKMPFELLINKRIFEPLKLINTSYVTNQEGVKNSALGYAKAGDTWSIRMYLGNDRGGGAIFSTAEDLVKWNDALSSGTLSRFVAEKLQEPSLLNNGRKLDYARGLSLDLYGGVPLIWHSGGAAGYHTWMGRIPAEGISLAVTCNSDARPASSLADQVLALFAASSTAKAEDGPPPALNPEQLTATKPYTGLFINDKTKAQLNLSIANNRFRVVGGPGLVALADGRYRRWGANVFFMSQDKFEIRFLSPDQLELKTMEGEISTYHRAKPVTVDKAELAALAGTYFSPEIGTTLHIDVQNEELSGKLNGAQGQAISLTPIAPDMYQFRGITLLFLKDQSGKVTGLSFSNPVVSRIQFDKRQ